MSPCTCGHARLEHHESINLPYCLHDRCPCVSYAREPHYDALLQRSLATTSNPRSTRKRTGDQTPGGPLE